MKKVKVILSVVLAVLLVGGAVFYHFCSVNEIKKQQQELMDARVAEILSQNEIEKKSLLNRIDELLAEDVIVVDSEKIAEEIKNIGELATTEYRYTNVGTLDGSKHFKIVDWKIPFTKKTIIVTMDGVLKAGIDFASISITTDEAARTITIRIPEAKILSNELVESSRYVYEEKTGLFNEETYEDGGVIREEIKQNAEKNAIDNKVLIQAKDNAENLIRCMLIETIPGIEDNYTVVFK